jgi:hypothetical protein
MENYFINVKIFIASSGDVITERNHVDKIIEEVNNLISDNLGISYQAIKWEKNSLSEMGRPQDVINHQLKITECDLFLGILWCRFGTPTGGERKDGTRFESGTEEEFELAYQSWREKGTPHIMFFRCAKKIDTRNFSIAQYTKVNSFFEKFGYDKEHPGLVTEYGEIKEFDVKLRRLLVQHAFKINKMKYNHDHDYESKVDLGMHFRNLGFNQLFLPSTNSIRDNRKKEVLKKAKTIKLISHAGYSFIAHFGNIFRSIIENRLENGCKLQIVLTNPWSEIGALVSTSSLNGGNIKHRMIEDSYGINTFHDPINIINSSKWYQIKHKDSINGYKELRRKYDNIELRLTQHFILSSILVVDDECFIEPYLGLNMLDRQEKDMLTFELNIDSKSELFGYITDYFNLIWALSEGYEAYEQNINEYKRRLEMAK